MINVPEPNPLVPHNFEMRELFVETAKEPVLLEGKNSWYLQDHKFQHPKAIIQCKVNTRDLGFGTNDPNGKLFALVWRKVLMEYASEYFYQGSRAGCTFYIEVNSDDITFYWRGYSETIVDFVQETINTVLRMKNAAETPDLEMAFNAAKEWLVKDLEGAAYQKSYRKAMDILTNILVQGNVSDQKMASLIGELDFAKFIENKGQWLRSGQTTWFVHGNIS